MKSKTNQAATAFSNTGPYTAKNTTQYRKPEQGSLYRDSDLIAIFGITNDGEPFVRWFDSRRIVGRRANGSLIGQQDTPEAMALLAWYRAVEPEASADDGVAVHAALDRVMHGNILAVETARLRDLMRETIVWCQLGDVRNDGESVLCKAKPANGLDLMTAATAVQEADSEAVVLNLLPFDAAVALHMTLVAWPSLAQEPGWRT